jgi:hypothetical protein
MKNGSKAAAMKTAKKKPAQQKVEPANQTTAQNKPPDTDPQKKTAATIKKPLVKPKTKPKKQIPVVKVERVPLMVTANVQAKVFVDDRLYGTVPPLKRIALTPGLHRIMFVRTSKKFPKTEVRVVNLSKGGGSMTVDHQFETFATIQSINAIPWGKVFIDGQYKGITPIQNVRISEGMHTIKIENPGFKPYFQNINVEGGKSIANIHAKLQRKIKEASAE